MPRCSRERKASSLYYIKQTCASGSCLFKTNQETQQFIYILTQLKASANFKLYGLRLDSSGFELLIHPIAADISNVMRSLMIQFAAVKRQNTPICKDRYKSQCLSNRRELEPYLSIFLSDVSEKRPFCDDIGPLFGLDSDQLNAFITQKDTPLRRDQRWMSEPFVSHTAITCIKSVDEGIHVLEDKLKALDLSLSDLKARKDLRDEFIRWFRQNSTLTLKEIGTVMGGLKESTVSKIIKNNSNEKR